MSEEIAAADANLRQIAKLTAALTAARAEAASLHAAVLAYGDHSDECCGAYHNGDRPCICGLDQIASDPTTTGAILAADYRRLYAIYNQVQELRYCMRDVGDATFGRQHEATLRADYAWKVLRQLLETAALSEPMQLEDAEIGPVAKIGNAPDRSDGLLDHNVALLELRTALERLVEAIAQARVAEDNWHRSPQDEATGMDWEDAEATVIIRENEARAVLAHVQ